MCPSKLVGCAFQAWYESVLRIIYLQYINRYRFMAARFRPSMAPNEITPLYGDEEVVRVVLSARISVMNGEIDTPKTTVAECPIRYLYRSSPSQRRASQKAVSLVLRVRRFAPSQKQQLPSAYLNNNNANQDFLPHSAIPPDSLPNLDDIEVWAMSTMIAYPQREALGGLRSAYFHFAHTYCASDKDLSLVSLLIYKPIRNSITSS